MQSEGSSFTQPQSHAMQSQRSQFYTPNLDHRQEPQTGIIESASSMTNIHYGEYDRMGSVNSSPLRIRTTNLKSTGCCNKTSSYTSRFPIIINSNHI